MKKLSEIKFIKKDRAYYYITHFNKKPLRSTFTFNAASGELINDSQCDYTSSVVIRIERGYSPYIIQTGSNILIMYINLCNHEYQNIYNINGMLNANRKDVEKGMFQPDDHFTKILNILSNMHLFYLPK